MISIEFLGVPMTPWRSLVLSCPDAEFESGSRSTLLLLDYWRKPQDALVVMHEKLGVTLENASLKFEHQTPVRDGRGKASHTDLLIDATDAAVAVEAKYNEPPYETVAEWSGATPTENRQKVLGGWLRCISDKAGVEVSPGQVAALPYQLIHRTASACAMNRKTTMVAYHLFDTLHRQYYLDSMGALAGECRSNNIRFVLLESPASQVPAFSTLLGRLDSEPRRAALIRDAILTTPAYSFGKTVAERVN